jgi:hypothetical protein
VRKTSSSTRTASTDLVEPSKADALETLGEGDRALGIANAWVRTKLASTAVTVDEPVAGEEL